MVDYRFQHHYIISFKWKNIMFENDDLTQKLVQIRNKLEKNKIFIPGVYFIQNSFKVFFVAENHRADETQVMFWKWNKLLSFAKRKCSNSYADTHFPSIKNPEDLAASVETNDCLKRILKDPDRDFAPLFETQEQISKKHEQKEPDEPQDFVANELEEAEIKKNIGSKRSSKTPSKIKSITFSAFELSCAEMLWTTIPRNRYQQITNDYRDLVHLATAVQEGKGKKNNKENRLLSSLQKQIDNHNATVSGYQLMTPSPSKLRFFQKKLFAFLDDRAKSKKQGKEKKEDKQTQEQTRKKLQQIHELWADLASSFDSRILKYIEGIAIKSGNALWNAQQSPKFSKESLCLAEYQAMKQTLLSFRKHFALQQKKVKNLSSSPPFQICLLTDSFNRCVGAQFGAGQESLFSETVSSPILPYFNNVNIDFTNNAGSNSSPLKQKKRKDESFDASGSQENLDTKEYARTRTPSTTSYSSQHLVSPDSFESKINFIKCGEPKVCKKSWNAFQQLLEKIVKTEKHQNQNSPGRKFVLLSY